ncbi:MAG: hypothetical protein WDO12_07710 [Pseudomonadota bacterium]
MLKNPYLIAEILLKNMEAFGKEGLVYLETQQGVDGCVKADGSPMSNDEVADIFRAALASPRAKATGVTVRLQNALLRFTPVAEGPAARALCHHRQVPRPVRRREHGGPRGQRQGLSAALPAGAARAAAPVSGDPPVHSTPAKSMNPTSTCATRCCSAPSASAMA